MTLALGCDFPTGTAHGEAERAECGAREGGQDDHATARAADNIQAFLINRTPTGLLPAQSWSHLEDQGSPDSTIFPSATAAHEKARG